MGPCIMVAAIRRNSMAGDPTVETKAKMITQNLARFESISRFAFEAHLHVATNTKYHNNL